MKRFYYPLLVGFSLSAVVFAMAFANVKAEQPDKHLEVVLRNIGHQLLLHAKDSTSRVLPVKAVNENTFRISFENNFEFTPDTLMNLVQQQLAKTDRMGDYVVSVNECVQGETIFAYEIKATGALMPCKGRVQKKGCYVIEITFLDKRSFNYAWLWLGLVPLAMLGLYLYGRRSKPVKGQKPFNDEQLISSEKEPDATSDELVQVTDAGVQLPDLPAPKQLGQFLFFETKGILTLNDETIELSAKEVKALSLFVARQNIVVERELLMKEIWEDDGVVVITRNVDVLVSKLRKKLSSDPSVRIVNVHGKGYKMITG